mmetsp:Transcript_23190/g.17617  ORF Transcript_23190/g.17617 Transcript_23190/m.17617 type:complete len:91 (+) Transcript_23190:383-655(+)
MLGRVVDIKNDEVMIDGYIRQNYLNAKRLVHITGKYPISFKIKRIMLSDDPCPLKVSAKEKEQVLATSKAQSIVNSRMHSRKGSGDAVMI